MLQLGTQVMVVKAVYSGSTNQTIGPVTFDAYGIEVNNDSGADMTVQINSLIVTVKNGEYFSGAFDPFTTVIVTASGAWRVHLLA